MGEPQRTIAVAGATPFALVLAGLLAADHGHKVFIVASRPAVNSIPPPPSFSVAPITRPDTLQLALANGPGVMRRIGKVAPDCISRVDLIVRADSQYHATALNHFRHLAHGFGLVAERVADSADSIGTSVRIRDVTQLSPSPLLTQATGWASRIGIEWVDDINSLAIRRNGSAQLGDAEVDLLVLADDEAIIRHLDSNAMAQFATKRSHAAFIAARGHGVSEPRISLSHGTLLDPLANGALALYADNSAGLAEALVAASLPDSAVVRRAAMRPYEALATHDAAPVVGIPKRSKTYVIAGLGMLDVAMAPSIARHIVGQAHGYEAEWCGMRAPSREMSGSMVAEIGGEIAA